ncbi:MAG: sigma-54-dependent transcriptional regulator [Longimicrobiales bacterium]
MASVLIVDDEPNIRRMLGSLLEAEGYHVRQAEDGQAALAAVTSDEPDVVLLDLALPRMNGLQVLERLRERWSHLPVVMMSGRATLADAVTATKLGAFHFIEKPLTPEAVLLTLSGALELRRARELSRALAAELGTRGRLVGSSSALDEVRALIDQVAGTDARVLITGESGTGKELVAAAIHESSPRRNEPFVRVNSAAIPRELVESEMFGHEKGSFTGAHERRRGRFELADGGTLFLDEIGDLGAGAQAKLLRALETGTIERVGGRQPVKVDVRVIAATNRDLQRAIAQGEFREDLYYRLNVIPLRVPPLRDRLGDVPELAAHFLAQLRVRHGLESPVLEEDAIVAMQRYHWPGNVRELANLCERLAILYPGRSIGAAEVGVLLGASAAPLEDDATNSLPDRLDSFERRIITREIEAAGGSIAEAARRLQTDRANLYRRMRRLGLDR